MDIKAKIDELVKKFQADPALLEQFTKDPVKAIEGLLGVDLPDEAVKSVIDGVKAKLTADSLGGVADKLKGLFGK